jgi:hypothetical protein
MLGSRSLRAFGIGISSSSTVYVKKGAGLAIAKHYFCSRCRIYVFHRKRAAPDHFGINALCPENFDAASRRTSRVASTAHQRT